MAEHQVQIRIEVQLVAAKLAQRKHRESGRASVRRIQPAVPLSDGLFCLCERLFKALAGQCRQQLSGLLHVMPALELQPLDAQRLELAVATQPGFDRELRIICLGRLVEPVRVQPPATKHLARVGACGDKFFRRQIRARLIA